MSIIVDPQEIRIVGENSFIRLAEREGGGFSTRASHWRVLFSPEGPGHVLFLQSELTENRVVVYADNIALARRLQEEIEVQLHAPFADTSLPVVDATFQREGSIHSFVAERVVSEDGDVVLTWYDFMEPFLFNHPAGVQGRTLSVYSVFFPARRAQLTLGGRVAAGRPVPMERGGREATSCCLAWAESWLKPRG
ncbi:MAG: hypothetical protein ACM3US_09475 [Sphingomonadaceae bacterium]